MCESIFPPNNSWSQINFGQSIFDDRRWIVSEDVDKIVAQKEKFHKHPVNYAMHKARLMKERDAALTNGDEARFVAATRLDLTRMKAEFFLLSEVDSSFNGRHEKSSKEKSP